jgi:5'-nucleotidase
MLRISLVLSATCLLSWFNLVHGQDTTAASPTDASPSVPATDDANVLKTENATLKKEVAEQAHTIAELQAKLAQGGQPPAATADATADVSTNAAPAGPMKALPLDATNAMANAAAPAADAGPSKTYKVVKGDSLWKIAHKMYPGDTKNGVDKIQEANKDAIGGKPLKIGQVLIIPQ